MHALTNVPWVLYGILTRTWYTNMVSETAGDFSSDSEDTVVVSLITVLFVFATLDLLLLPFQASLHCWAFVLVEWVWLVCDIIFFITVLCGLKSPQAAE